MWRPRAMSTAITADARGTATAVRERCAHCGLEAAAGEARHLDGAMYCCAGCETAASIIRQSGLTGFYSLPDKRTTRVRSSGRSFAEFDHDAFQTAHVRRTAEGLAEVSLYLEGVHCASCVWLVERVPLAVPGAVRAELDVTRAVAQLAWDPERTTLSALARVLDQLGYRPHPFRGRRADEARRAEERAMLTRIGVAGAIAANVMTIALALYSGWFGDMDAEFERYFRWLSFALVTPALFWPGRVFFRSAWAAVRARGLHMDVPIAVALAAGYLQGAFNTWRDAGPIYFDAVATLIFLLLVGRYLQHRAQRSAADAAALLGALSPDTARLVEGDAVRDVPTEAVLPGMLVEVRAGDTLPADGTVETGRSSLDLAMLTGEARPESVGEGAAVFAGTLNLTSTLRVRVTEAGETSRIGKLLREVERGARERAPVVLFADRMSGWFIATVLALAVTTVVLWWGRDRFAAVDHAIALLVITCPCALAMATPLSFTVAIGRAARRGILIKGGHALESLTGRGVVYLDKTGTVTEGRLALEHWDGTDDVRVLVLGLERRSRHPVAAAFAAAWSDVPVPEPTEAREELGCGLEGRVNGRRVVVGKPTWVRQRVGLADAEGVPHSTAAFATAGNDAGLTPVLVAVDGAIVARAGFGDPVRPQARAAVDELRARGWDVRLLSGDAPEVVTRVALALGLDPSAGEGGATPERKRDVIRNARAAFPVTRITQSDRPVVMVGDGVNDAAAISIATVGVAVSGGAEASMAAADVYLARGGIGALGELLDGARRTSRIVRRNMLIALGYNAIGVSLAMMGVIDPLFAAVLMPVSSLTVVLGAWQGRTFPREAA